jgi:hypothetical protein
VGGGGRRGRGAGRHRGGLVRLRAGDKSWAWWSLPAAIHLGGHAYDDPGTAATLLAARPLSAPAGRPVRLAHAWLMGWAIWGPTLRGDSPTTVELCAHRHPLHAQQPRGRPLTRQVRSGAAEGIRRSRYVSMIQPLRARAAVRAATIRGPASTSGPASRIWPGMPR